MKRRILSVVALVAVAAAGSIPASALSESWQSRPSRATAKYLAPSTFSPECRRGASRTAACGVIVRFFRALNSGQFGSACALLGEQLRDQNRGLGCPRFLSVGYPEPMPWGILGARRSGSGAVVLITLGQSELDHIRMRRHLAYVAFEGGRLRILETKLLR